jgi:hypothetical protein
MVGKIRLTELAAVLSEIVFILLSIGIGFSTSNNTACAEADAEKKDNQKNRTTFITDYCYVPFWDLCLWLRYFLNKYNDVYYASLLK